MFIQTRPQHRHYCPKCSRHWLCGRNCECRHDLSSEHLTSNAWECGLCCEATDDCQNPAAKGARLCWHHMTGNLQCAVKGCASWSPMGFAICEAHRLLYKQFTLDVDMAPGGFARWLEGLP